jgi:hypothetical protein
VTDDPRTTAPGTGFQAGGTPGGRCGCGLAGLLIACCMPLIGVAAMATRGMGDWLLHGWLPVVLAAATLGLAVRALINRAWRRRRGEDARAPLWTIAAAAAATAAAVALLHWWWLRPY